MSRREWLLFALYGALMAVGAWHHEPWRDELRALIVSQLGRSPADLLSLLGWEGHPSLWYLWLRPWTGLFGPLIGLKLAGLASALLAGWSLVRLRPLALWIRGGVLFGYYWLYEYGVVSRSYGLGLALTCLGVGLWLERRRRWVPALLLGLAANAHVLIALINLPLLAVLVLQDLPADRRRGRGQQLLLAALLVLLLTGGSLATAVRGHSQRVGMHMLQKNLPGPVASPRTVPQGRLLALGGHLEGLVDPTIPLQAARLPKRPALRPLLTGLNLGVVLLLWLGLLRRSPLVAVGYTLPSLAVLLGFFQFVYPPHPWHLGLPWLVLVLSLLLASRPPQSGPRRPWGLQRLNGALLVLLLLLSDLHGLHAWTVDWRAPFSAAAAAEQTLRSRGIPPERRIIADPELADSLWASGGFRPVPVLPHQPPLLLPWPRLSRLPEAEACRLARELHADGRGPVAIVRNANQRRPTGPDGQPLQDCGRRLSLPASREPIDLYLLD
ncbi:MAG: hypothetical protein ACK55H_05885 [Cyanobacteriota bacterium]